MALVYKKAVIEDLEFLLEIRIKILRIVNHLDDSVDMSEVESQSRAYFKQAFADDSQVSYFVYDEDHFVGAGGVCFYRVMPTYHNPNGWKAYLMNIYTDPAYRRQGIGRQMVDLLVKEAKKRGIEYISLDATVMGKPLYEKYGFAYMPDEMLLQK